MVQEETEGQCCRKQKSIVKQDQNKLQHRGGSGPQRDIVEERAEKVS
jgi:hypothetical protein